MIKFLQESIMKRKIHKKNKYNSNFNINPSKIIYLNQIRLSYLKNEEQTHQQFIQIRK